ncbi:MAG: hypothetical protein NTU80_06170 [Verrucomicrobia bacterium]|nr:hypothetical protein [Verrucomicrobiota bacterium]
METAGVPGSRDSDSPSRLYQLMQDAEKPPGTERGPAKNNHDW